MAVRYHDVRAGHLCVWAGCWWGTDGSFESGHWRSLLHPHKIILCQASRVSHPFYSPELLDGQDRMPQGRRINLDRWMPRCSIVHPAEWRPQQGSVCCSCSRRGISTNISASNVEHRQAPRPTTSSNVARCDIVLTTTEAIYGFDLKP